MAQVDFALDPSRRLGMREVGQCSTVPQVHAKGKVSKAPYLTCPWCMALGSVLTYGGAAGRHSRDFARA